MWRDTEIQAQPGISNICYVDLLALIVINGNNNICISWYVNVIASKSGQEEYK